MGNTIYTVASVRILFPLRPLPRETNCMESWTRVQISHEGEGHAPMTKRVLKRPPSIDLPGRGDKAHSLCESGGELPRLVFDREWAVLSTV